MSDIQGTVHGDKSEQTSFGFKFPQDPALYLSRSLWEITRIHLKYTSLLAKFSMARGETDLRDGVQGEKQSQFQLPVRLKQSCFNVGTLLKMKLKLPIPPPGQPSPSSRRKTLLSIMSFALLKGLLWPANSCV